MKNNLQEGNDCVVEFPEMVMDWHWEMLREESDDMLTAGRDIPAPLILFIKYVLGHTECYPKDTQSNVVQSWATPKLGLDNYSIYKPFKIRKEQALELANLLPYIQGNDEQCLWLSAKNDDSEYVDIFFKGLAHIDDENYGAGKEFLNNGYVGYYSLTSKGSFIEYHNGLGTTELTREQIEKNLL